MNVSLTPELEQLINDKVKTGVYQTASKVIRESLRLLPERDQVYYRKSGETLIISRVIHGMRDQKVAYFLDAE